MNRAFKVIWNSSRQAWMAVGELTRGKSKSSTKSARKLTQVISATLLATGLSVTALPAWSINHVTNWIGADGYWAGGGDWDMGDPVAGDFAYIDNGGTVMVDTTGAVASYLIIGDTNTGTLEITNGGSVSVDNSILGYSLGGTGTATVDGLGSSWDNSGSFYVGHTGTGSLEITNGGSVSNVGHGYIGHSSGSTGTATVDGTNSSWDSGNNLYVGYSGTGSLEITNGGSVSNIHGFIGDLSGSTGTVTIDGTNSSWDNSGNIIVGYYGTGSLTILNGGAVNVNNGTVNIAVTFGSSAGTLNIGAASGDTAAAAGTLNAATVTFGGGTGAVVFNHTETTYDFAPNITGLGSVDLLSGSTRFAGDLSAYTGTLTVNGGTLALGSGDTLSVGGDYSQTASGVLSIGAADDTTFGKLVVAGTATLASNAQIDVDVTDPNYSFTATSLDDIISAGTLTSDGTFAVTDNSLLFDFGAVVDGNTVDLTTGVTAPALVRTSVANQGTTAALGAAGVIDDVIASSPTSTLATSFISLTTEQEVADAVESTLPGVSGGAAQLTNISTNAVTHVIASRQDLLRGLSSGDGFMTDRHIWFKPFGGRTDQDTRQGVTGYDIDSYGLALGVDGDISSSLNMGFALAYINSDVESDLAAGSHAIDMDSYMAKAYATKMFDAVTALNLQVGAGVSEYDSKRRIFTGDVADADYDSWNVQVSAELERSYQVTDITVMTPYVHADYGYVNVEDYNESGAGALNLEVDDDSADSLIIGAGVKGNHAVSESLLLMANAGVGYDVMSDRSSLTSSFAGGGAQFTTDGIEPDEWVYNAGVGAKYSLSNGTEITASYNIDAREDYTDQSLSATFRMMF